MSLPKHRNPSAARTASAPYNFVPLPEKVIKAVENADQLPDHDSYVNKDYPHTGYFDVMLTTKSPLYIRCAFPLQKFLAQERGEDKDKPYTTQVKNTPEFFYTSDPNQPVIPGSSLRGMLRNLLEIVTYSKVQWLTDKRLFFRTVDDSAVGTYYRERMVETVENVKAGNNPVANGYRSKVRAGFFKVNHDGSYAIEECIIARLEINEVVNAFGKTHRRELYQLGRRDLTDANERNPNQTPKWDFQHKPIWVEIDLNSAEKPEFFKRKVIQGHLIHPDLYLYLRRARNATTVAGPNGPKQKQGTLVLTGHMQSKHMAFVFVPAEKPNIISVPNDPREDDINRRLVDLFNDDDQITQWQASAFPDGKPDNAHRNRAGALRNGEPVFFLCEGDQLTFFGRTQMFRLPYHNRPLDLVPDELRRPEDVDFAEAMFGFVRTRRELTEMKQRGIIKEFPNQGNKARAYASRVFVTDAVLTKKYSPSELWLTGGAHGGFAPKILATPKPTAFQHYLIQPKDEPNPNIHKRTLSHYDSPTETEDGLRSEETAIRGHKLYWHQGDRSEEDLRAKHPDEDPTVDPHTRREFSRDAQGRWQVKDTSKQHTQIKPIKSRVQFKFRVYFENLRSEELGMLCWVLQPRGDPNKTYCHSLGMGKPLGMGAVKLDASLYLTKRDVRYGSLFDGDQWQTGVKRHEGNLVSESLEDYAALFEKSLLAKLNTQPPCDQLAGLKRIAMLLKMLEWQDSPTTNTRTLTLQEFRDRRVLPHPLSDNEMKGLAEPQVVAAKPASGSAHDTVPGEAPESEFTATSVSPAIPYKIGDVFTGKVIQKLDNGDVILKAPKMETETGYARISALLLARQTYTVGQDRRCEVIEISVVSL